MRNGRQRCHRDGVVLVELNLGGGPARLDDPEDLTSFTVVLEGDGDPSPEALAAGGVGGLGDHAWVRTDALRRLAGPIATPEDAAFILAHCPSCHGFYGASSMERLPTEIALTETTRRFTQISGDRP